MKKTILYLAFSLLGFITKAQTNRCDSILGFWMDEKKESKVFVYKHEGKYYAKLLWVENLSHRGKPLPEDKKHWIGMIVMKDFVYKKEEWVDGKIYQPKTGKSYSAYVKLINPNTIKVTGYVLLPIFNESNIFKRVSK